MVLKNYRTLTSTQTYDGTASTQTTDLPRDFLIQRQFAKSKSVLQNEAIIAVMSASIVAPFVVPKINSLMDTVPILRDHKSIAAFVSGLVIFGISKSVKQPMIRAVVIGVAGAFVLSALLPLYSSLTTRNAGGQ